MMASTEDRMRENRRVLAEITKSERTVIRLLQRDARGRARAAQRDRCPCRHRQADASSVGAGGTVMVLLLSEWIGSFFR